jgi:hypothetical protein
MSAGILGRPESTLKLIIQSNYAHINSSIIPFVRMSTLRPRAVSIVNKGIYTGVEVKCLLSSSVLLLLYLIHCLLHLLLFLFLLFFLFLNLLVLRLLLFIPLLLIPHSPYSTFLLHLLPLLLLLL